VNTWARCWLTATLVSALFVGCGGSAGSRPVLVGSLDTAEGEVLANLYAELLEANGIDAEARPRTGDRATTLQALGEGQVQLVPEYSGDALDALAGRAEATPDPAETASALRQLARVRGLSVFDPNRDADASLAVVVTFETAEDTRIFTVSGLARLPGVSIGVLDGQRRLRGLDAERVVELADTEAALVALHRGSITAVVVPATSAGLAGTGDVMLVDDATGQPANSVIPIANLPDDSQRRTIYRIFDQLAEELTTADLRELNRRVEIEGESPAAATRDLVEDKGLDG